MYNSQIELKTLRNRKREPLKHKRIAKDLSLHNINSLGDNSSKALKESQVQSQKYYILHKVSGTDTLQGICIKYNVTKYDLKIGNFLSCLFDVNDSLLLRNIIFIPFDKNKFCYGKTRSYDHDLVKIHKDCKDVDLYYLSKAVENELKTYQNLNKHEINNPEVVIRVPLSFYKLRKLKSVESENEILIIVKINHLTKIRKKKNIIRATRNCFCDYPNLPLKHDNSVSSKSSAANKNNVFDFNIFNSKLKLNNLSWLEDVVQIKNITFNTSTTNLKELKTVTNFTKKFSKVTDCCSLNRDASKSINEYISMVSLK